MNVKSKKIFLIHGLGGVKDQTWGRFPSLLENDSLLSEYEVIPLGYQSPPLWKIFARAPTIDSLSRGLLEEIINSCDTHDEIIIAGHSLGGIILKKIMLILNARHLNLNVSKICFFDTPHHGSGYANVGSKITMRNRHLKQLINNSSELNDLVSQWGDSKLDDRFEVANFIASNDDYVSRTSAQGHYIDNITKIINNTDHLSIVKPKSDNDLSYQYFREFILKKKSIAQNLITNSNLLGLKTYQDWGEITSIRQDVIPYVQLDSRKSISIEILQQLMEVQKICRLEALAGLGKTRLAYELFNNNYELQDKIIYIDAAMDSLKMYIVAQVSSWISNKKEGIIIVDNCEQGLHISLVEEVTRSESQFSLLSIDYNKTNISYPTSRFVLEPLANEELKLLLSPVYLGKIADFNKIVEFAQGFPKIAVLLADARLNNTLKIGELTDDQLADKLLFGGEFSQNKHDVEKVLCFFSLFHAVNIDESNDQELKFISDNTIQNLDETHRIVQKYIKKSIIDQRGRFCQLIPMPLAVRLAAKWWEDERSIVKEEVIDQMPDSMHNSFCQQLQKMYWHPEAKIITDSICDKFSQHRPFGNANITIRDSRLIRALSYVNPVRTSKIIKSYLGDLSHTEILNLDSIVRREFYWSLERTVFPKESFDNSIYSLLYLARAETENYSNNASNLFKQIYSIYLSGTEVEPKLRQDFFEMVLDQGKEDDKEILLAALSRVLSNKGYSRMGGSEEQGYLPPLVDWEPKNNQEIVDYIVWGFNNLLVFIEDPNYFEAALSIFTDTFYPYLGNAQLSITMQKCFSLGLELKKGNWPEIEKQIDIIKRFNWVENADSNKVLIEWESKLKSQNFSFLDNLNRIVVNPILLIHSNEDREKRDEEIIKFSRSIIENSLEIKLFENLHLLLTYNEYPFQSQAYFFGKQLVKLGIDKDLLFNQIINFFDQLDEQKNVYLEFVKGVYRAIYDENIDIGYTVLEGIKSSVGLSKYFIEFCFMGVVRENDLIYITEQIQSNYFKIEDLRKIIFYISDSDMSHDQFMNFIENISDDDIEGQIIALEMLNSYRRNNRSILLKEKALDFLHFLVMNVPIIGNPRIDFYEWESAAIVLSKNNNLDTFIYDVSKKIFYSYLELNTSYSDGMRNFLFKIVEIDHKQVWKAFIDFMDTCKVSVYDMRFLLGEVISFESYKMDVFSRFDVNDVMAWLKLKKTDSVLLRAFAASMQIYIKNDERLELSPLVIPFLLNFGADVSIRNAVKEMTRSWGGSAVPGLRSELEVIMRYKDHDDMYVRLWAKDIAQYLQQYIDVEKRNTDERTLIF